jgi:hypothetical protein
MGEPTILTEHIRGFPQSLQENTGIVPGNMTRNFLTHPFSIHYSLIAPQFDATGSSNSSVGISTRLQDVRLKSLASNPGRGKRFNSSIFWDSTPCNSLKPTLWRNMSPPELKSKENFAFCLLYAGFLLGLLFNSEDEGDIFLQKFD